MNVFKNKINAFTLAEVMVCFFVIGVVIAVSLGIYQTQLSIVKKYQYYAAFSNLKLAVGELVADGTQPDPESSTVEKLLPPSASHVDAAHPLHEGMCERFSRLVNVIGTVDCSKTITSAGPFTAANANFSVSSGIRYFNFGSNPTANGGNGLDYYTFYVDMNGAFGNGIAPYNAKRYTDLDVDIVPFRVYRSGTVVPGLDAGGNGPGRSYLTASVKYNNGTTDLWYEKAVPYLDAACHAGIVTGTDCPSGLTIQEPPCTTYTCSVEIGKP